MPVSNHVQRVHQFTVLEDSDFSLMFRVYGADAAAITRASLTSITYTVWDLDATDPTSSVDSGTLTVADVVFDTLQSDDRWTTDDVGYNFRHDVADTVCSTGGHTYRIEHKFTASGGQIFFLVSRVQCEPVMTP